MLSQQGERIKEQEWAVEEGRQQQGGGKARHRTGFLDRLSHPGRQSMAKLYQGISRRKREGKAMGKNWKIYMYKVQVLIMCQIKQPKYKITTTYAVIYEKPPLPLPHATLHPNHLFTVMGPYCIPAILSDNQTWNPPGSLPSHCRSANSDFTEPCCFQTCPCCEGRREQPPSLCVVLS